MQKLNKLIIVLALIGFSFTQQAQTTILNETLLTEISFNTFTPYSVTGTQGWYFNPQYGALCSGYTMGQSYENEDWLISPIMDLSQTDNAILSFDHTRGNAAVMNVGVADGWYKAFATANYTGDPLTTQWVELEGLNQNIPQAWQYVSSGDVVIPDAAKSANSRIAFRYQSSNGQSATWEIKNVKVTDEQEGIETETFKITNWNTEWLGCSTFGFGPEDDEQQIENVAAAMLLMNSDVYCIQEVSNTASTPSIATLVSLLGSDQWGGTIAPSNTGECNQRQGIIYKKSRVQFVNASEMSSGNAAQGNTYYYNWSSGRFPALYNVNLLSGSTTIPVSLVNIHAKAEDGDAMSYTRRLGASQALKTILDGPNYNTKNVIVIGDFNDYLIGTTSNTCNCSVSPFKNFMDDTANYTGITQYLTNNWGDPLIENTIVSNELADNYVGNSAVREVTVPNSIFDYYKTTSNHLPISAQFRFEVLGTQDVITQKDSWTMYPNPVKDVLNIYSPDTLDGSTEIYDMTGRKVLYTIVSNKAINVSALPAGIYILKIGEKSGKFVKG